MKIVEMFSGIGSQAKALERISEKRNINMEVSMTCEWDIHAFLAYDFIHNSSIIDKEVELMSKEDILDELGKYNLSSNGKSAMNQKQLKQLSLKLLKHIFSAIIKNNNMVDIQSVKGKDIPDDTDLLTYSFPCQDLSNVGSFHGYKHGIDKDKNTRSGLLWEIERMLEEKKEANSPLPKYLLLENVTALEAKRHKGNFDQWKDKLEELGYYNKVYKLNAQDFGIPQYRKRIIMLSVFVGNDDRKKDIIDSYFKTHDLNDITYLRKLNIKHYGVDDFLKLDYSEDYLLKEALEAQPNDTVSRRKIWEQNSKIVNERLEVAKRVQTITTKQDRHPNSGNIYFNTNHKSKFRFLTPRECFLFMGFDEKDYDVLLSNNMKSRKNSLFFSRDVLYKLAGNSIVVNVLENVFDQMLDVEYLINEHIVESKEFKPIIEAQ